MDREKERESEGKRKKKIKRGVEGKTDVRERERGLYFRKDCNKSARLISDEGSQKTRPFGPLFFFLKNIIFLIHVSLHVLGAKNVSWKVGK